ncbi:MAG: glycoside hydrolase family 47 protein [Chitinophagaceae bacterium]|nr:glycoside hydrolase family 47 protein [Chitinophagaceae bacterium]
MKVLFTMYRLTGELKYLWQGKVMVDDIIRHCKTDVAFASLKNVQTFERSNSGGSFFFGETLK